MVHRQLSSHVHFGLYLFAFQRSKDSSGEAEIKRLFQCTDSCPTANVLIEKLRSLSSAKIDSLCFLTKAQLIQVLKAFGSKGLSKLAKPQLVHRLSCYLNENALLQDERPLMSLMQQHQ